MAQKQGQHTNSWAGWVGFASILMVLDGIFNIIYGLGALARQGWYLYTPNGTYVLNTASWGWTMLITGIILAYAGFALARGSLVGRALGIGFAAISLLANLATLPVAPLWSLLAIVVSGLVIYAIATHGSELAQHRH